VAGRASPRQAAIAVDRVPYEMLADPERARNGPDDVPGPLASRPAHARVSIGRQARAHAIQPVPVLAEHRGRLARLLPRVGEADGLVEANDLRGSAAKRARPAGDLSPIGVAPCRAAYADVRVEAKGLQDHLDVPDRVV